MLKKLRNFYHQIASVVAYWFYGRPARAIVVIGVTGTKGKSTTCRFIASALEAAGYKVGMLTTVEFQIADKRIANIRKMTMLGRGEIHKMLRQMVRAGCRYAVIETSSEGILQHRHYGLHYDVAVFTNLAPEHIEAHGGFENLRRDKGKIFAALSADERKIIGGQKIEKIIAVNLDDANASYYLQFAADKKIGFGVKFNQGAVNFPAVRAWNLLNTPGGVRFMADNTQFDLQISGAFNVYNALAAIAVGRALGLKDTAIAAGIVSVKIVAGRMEFIDEGQSFKVVVDFAHEPLSLTELFSALRAIAPGKIIALVGSDGGGRDVGKRGKMGEVAGRLADVVIVTDVNCYDEDPRAIAEMLAGGARAAGKKDGVNLFVEIDRRHAIELAVGIARPGDVIALTAKGTEPYIAVAGGKKIPWDDRVVAREVLKSKI